MGSRIGRSPVALYAVLMLAACDAPPRTLEDAGPDAARELVDATPRDAEPVYVKDTVDFEPAPGAYTQLPTLSLRPASRSVQLYYTLDGSAPSDASQPYEGPIPLDATTLVRVVSYRDGAAVHYASGSYVQLAEDVAEVSSSLPLLIVHTLDGPLPSTRRDVHVPAIFQTHHVSESGRAQLQGPANDQARAGFKVHGRRTRAQEKKSYNLEVWNDYDDSDNELAPMLDLPPQSDWVLYAPFEIDRALIRNALIYELSNTIGRYAARTRFVEMYLAESGHPVDSSKYIGVYVVIESLKRDRFRVPVERLDSSLKELPAISGGYILKADEPDRGEKRFSVENYPRQWVLRYPQPENLNAEQEQYIGDYLNACGRASLAADLIDPESGQQLYEMIDRASFIDMHILNLFAKNVDAWRLSSYYYKHRNNKLMAGPIWDCDRCMGAYDVNVADPNGWNPTGSSVN
ncbi:MAG TPA: CotH kinase family protein, partial [Polyangiales bacterium]|nr:CotH kinase family protein [Polyangiales bacterium]